MRIGILADPPSLSAYVGEILQTWGLAMWEAIGLSSLQGLDPGETPVVICPSAGAGQGDASLVHFARSGGTVIAFLPSAGLAAAAGVNRTGKKEGPLRLRVTGTPASGLAGELLPVVGGAEAWTCAEGVNPLAYLSHPGRYTGEAVGVTETRVGQGRIVCFAFDPALCVLLLRQGDPARSEQIPGGDGCARPSHLACDIGPADPGWVPYADLMSRLVADTAARTLGGPAPMLWHLPGAARGILLYSGDEDFADVAWNEEELEAVASAGGRMSLYLIPTRTKSTRRDADRYARHHDLGPHPDLRSLDRTPVADRVAEFERQVRLFGETFGRKALTVRNHCTAWAGYLDLVEVMARLGVRMDGNYFSGTYMRDRQPGPYAGFGGAMPMRFCRPDGALLDVFQQHTHLSDDVMFSPTADYSFKFLPDTWEGVQSRIYSDIETRFHTPLAVCIHPGNWVRFSRVQGRSLLRGAAERGMPIWSFDQWMGFWEARDRWRFRRILWQGGTLRASVGGERGTDGLTLALPDTWEGQGLAEVRIDGKPAVTRRITAFGRTVALADLSQAGSETEIRATWGGGGAP